MSRRNIPIPAGFAAVSKLRKRDLAERFGVSQSLIMRWRQRIGQPGGASRKLVVPDDFATVAPGKSLKELVAHYGVSEPVIERWRRETGAPPKRTGGSVPTPMPADFAEVYHSVGSLKGAMEHYHRDYKTIRRWMGVAGIEPNRAGGATAARFRRYTPAASQEKVKPITSRFVLPGSRFIPPAPLTGRDEEAAQYLRRLYPCVYRCTDHGTADQKGKRWRCGSLVLTPAELIDRAEAKGWDPDAWRKVA